MFEVGIKGFLFRWDFGIGRKVMLNDDKYAVFKYLLECYFNCSFNYDELYTVIGEFNKDESQLKRLKFRNELQSIMANGKLIETGDFVRKYGMRRMPVKKVKWFVNYLLEHIEGKRIYGVSWKMIE